VVIRLAGGPGTVPGIMGDLPDRRLRGLLHVLRDDPRVQAFAERELGPLLRRDDAAGGQLIAVLTAFLEAGGTRRRPPGEPTWPGRPCTSGCVGSLQPERR
jgi:hypothetical protein